MDQKFYVSDERVAELKPIPGKKYEKRDAQWPGLLVRVEASGKKSYYYRYSLDRRVRWFRIGPSEMGAAAAKKRARQLIGVVALGGDPQAERKKQRGGLTFEQLHARYLTEHAMKHNKSWKQGRYLLCAFVYPKWAKRPAASITRDDVKELIASIGSPTTANQVRANLSPVFSFAVEEKVVASNPCLRIKRNKTTDRDRILSDSEVGQLWAACEKIHPVKAAALRVTLLLGARPGEVCHMRWEHIRDNWWEQPGPPITKEGSGRIIWPGTKNHCNHRVWLPARVRELIGLDAGHPASGFVFATSRGRAYGQLGAEMRKISRMCEFDPPVTAHDLRRSFASTVTGRGHGIPAMERVINHGKRSVYDRANYAKQDQAIWEDVVSAILALAEGRQEEDNVVGFHR
jgi:integrase